MAVLQTAQGPSEAASGDEGHKSQTSQNEEAGSVLLKRHQGSYINIYKIIEFTPGRRRGEEKNLRGNFNF